MKSVTENHKSYYSYINKFGKTIEKNFKYSSEIDNIFDQNLDFGRKSQVSTKIPTFNQNLNFRPKSQVSNQMVRSNNQEMPRMPYEK